MRAPRVTPSEARRQSEPPTEIEAPDTIYYVLGVKLVDEVPMLERRRKQAADWLRQWTPKNNFKAIMCDDREVAIKKFCEEMQRTCAIHDYPAANFELTLFSTEVEFLDGVLCFDHNAEAAARHVLSFNAGTGATA